MAATFLNFDNTKQESIVIDFKNFFMPDFSDFDIYPNTYGNWKTNIFIYDQDQTSIQFPFIYVIDKDKYLFNNQLVSKDPLFNPWVRDGIANAVGYQWGVQDPYTPDPDVWYKACPSYIQKGYPVYLLRCGGNNQDDMPKQRTIDFEPLCYAGSTYKGIFKNDADKDIIIYKKNQSVVVAEITPTDPSGHYTPGRADTIATFYDNQFVDGVIPKSIAIEIVGAGGGGGSGHGWDGANGGGGGAGAYGALVIDLRNVDLHHFWIIRFGHGGQGGVGGLNVENRGQAGSDTFLMYRIIESTTSGQIYTDSIIATFGAGGGGDKGGSWSDYGEGGYGGSFSPANTTELTTLDGSKVWILKTFTGMQGHKGLLSDDITRDSFSINTYINGSYKCGNMVTDPQRTSWAGNVGSISHLSSSSSGNGGSGANPGYSGSDGRSPACLIHLPNRI